MGLIWTGSIEDSHYVIPYGSLLGDSLLNPSDGSFDGSSDVPPKGALLGVQLKRPAVGPTREAFLWP